MTAPTEPEAEPATATAEIPRVKICGVTTPRDRELVVAAGADALGVVCGVPVETPREVPPEGARELVAGTPPFVTATLVTMPQDAAAGARLVERVGADAVQVHGLDAGAVADLGDRTPASVVAAADAGASRETLTALADAADAVHLDSTDDDGAGGTGRTHDWERARELVVSLDTPVVLAGGLDPDNVAAAVRTVRPYAVDVASGTDRERDGGDGSEGAPGDDGRKAPDRVRAFVARATAADVDTEADRARAPTTGRTEGEGGDR